MVSGLNVAFGFGLDAVACCRLLWLSLLFNDCSFGGLWLLGLFTSAVVHCWRLVFVLAFASGFVVCVGYLLCSDFWCLGVAVTVFECSDLGFFVLGTLVVCFGWVYGVCLCLVCVLMIWQLVAIWWFARFGFGVLSLVMLRFWVFALVGWWYWCCRNMLLVDVVGFGC